MKKISENAYVSKMADIEDSTRGSEVVIKEGSVIDSFVKIKFAGGLGNVTIGKNCQVNSGVVIYSGNGVWVGNNVLIAANCTLASVNHEYRSRDKLIREQGFIPEKGGIIIEDDVWIGANTVILDGSRIRKGAVIGAHSLVNMEVPEYSVYAGNPLKRLGMRT